MKFLSSSSSSASSTITTTTTSSLSGSNICNSKTANTSCLSGVLRRLLCFNSLPTYPSEQIKDLEITSVEYDHKLQHLEEKVGDTAPPGVVARLMGLESMPANTQMTSNSISRSRSMNSVDSCKEFESIQGSHRRVKTSLSFRETPTFLELDEYFVLSFENGSETKKLGLKSKKSDVGFREMKSRKTESSKNKSNRRHSVYEKHDKENIQETNKVVSEEKLSRRINQKPSRKVGNNGKVIDSSNVLRPTKNSNGNSHVAMEVAKQSKPINHNGNSDGVKSRKKKKKKKKESVSVAKKAQTECDSENSSPVSVLDFGEFITDPKVPTSVEDSRLTDSNSRRKLSEIENFEHSPPCYTDSSSSVSNDKEAKIFEGKFHGSRKNDEQSQNYAEMWCEICKMAEQELTETKWVCREMWKLEDFEEDKVADFGFQILEELLNELVDQLAGTSGEENSEL